MLTILCRSALLNPGDSACVRSSRKVSRNYKAATVVGTNSRCSCRKRKLLIWRKYDLKSIGGLDAQVGVGYIMLKHNLICTITTNDNEPHFRFIEITGDYRHLNVTSLFALRTAFSVRIPRLPRSLLRSIWTYHPKISTRIKIPSWNGR